MGFWFVAVPIAVAGSVWFASDKLSGAVETIGDETEDVTRSFTDLILVLGALYLAYLIMGGTYGK